MTNACVVLTTAGSADEARRIARELVARRLAACVNIVPQIESVYRWQGKVETAAEWLLVVKTVSTAFDGLCAALKALHSYEIPECIMLTVHEGGHEYLAWIDASVD
jgi:periplasmic divalent cation tolerance protein